MKRKIEWLKTKHGKRYIYGVIISLAPLMVLWGWIEEAWVPHIGTAALAILGIGIIGTPTLENETNPIHTGSPVDSSSENVKPDSVIQQNFSHEYYENNDDYLG